MDCRLMGSIHKLLHLRVFVCMSSSKDIHTHTCILNPVWKILEVYPMGKHCVHMQA